jgi:hypothetical protein
VRRSPHPTNRASIALFRFPSNVRLPVALMSFWASETVSQFPMRRPSSFTL